jgi:hypothetical protein
MNKRDLTKPFITAEDELILISHEGENWYERYVHSYDGLVWWFWPDGLTGKECNYNPNHLTAWDYAKHLPEKRKFTVVDAIEMLWRLNKEKCVVVRHRQTEDYFWSGGLESNMIIKDYQYGFLENGEVKEWLDFPEEV